jgi:hypothetical protein
MKSIMPSVLFALVLAALPASAGMHEPWDTILKEYSRDGWVDYARLKDHRAPLDGYLAALRDTEAAVEQRWSRGDRLAFWINAYNALTVRTILDAYPIKKGWGFAALAYPESSIKQIKGAFDGKKHAVAGRLLTLNELEDDILRGELDEPRIHFAIVCASIGCPPLRAEAFRADALDEQFESGLENFLADGKVAVDARNGTISLSKIFKWFEKDFRRFDRGLYPKQPKAARGPLEFLGERLDAKTREELRTRAFSLSWQSYDWSLNDKRLK